MFNAIELIPGGTSEQPIATFLNLAEPEFMNQLIQKFKTPIGEPLRLATTQSQIVTVNGNRFRNIDFQNLSYELLTSAEFETTGLSKNKNANNQWQTISFYGELEHFLKSEFPKSKLLLFQTIIADHKSAQQFISFTLHRLKNGITQIDKHRDLYSQLPLLRNILKDLIQYISEQFSNAMPAAHPALHYLEHKSLAGFTKNQIKAAIDDFLDRFNSYRENASSKSGYFEVEGDFPIALSEILYGQEIRETVTIEFPTQGNFYYFIKELDKVFSRNTLRNASTSAHLIVNNKPFNTFHFTNGTANKYQPGFDSLVQFWIEGLSRKLNS